MYFSGDEVWCDCTEERMQIVGGDYILTKQLKIGSMLVYQCPEGYYPYPHLTRLCELNSSWNPAPKRFLPQRCKRKWCDDNVSHLAIGCLHYMITQIVLFCRCWMPRPQCDGVRKHLPSSGEVLCGQWDHIWVLLWIQIARLLQTCVLTQWEVEWLHSHL